MSATKQVAFIVSAKKVLLTKKCVICRKEKGTPSLQRMPDDLQTLHGAFLLKPEAELYKEG